ncbi:hypothetical protein GA0074696_4818 [Micromonospora purpureochromogenes]|uniref:Uncharacterized protein n=1 Tax=Micromonospora purpureochromogenes TaxID=47872 RepID=A0A1C4ZS77_9ACTN|nr:hypothetical protein [Micromonospora purpureochromogenes]SCF35853.1 hypothetical protein GA0074696_4818 [Micromonospora purpureochromogenes]
MFVPDRTRFAVARPTDLPPSEHREALPTFAAAPVPLTRAGATRISVRAAALATVAMVLGTVRIAQLQGRR